MDEERFDSLARQLGALTSRRQVLRGLVGALAGALAGHHRLSIAALDQPALACNVDRCVKQAEQDYVHDAVCKAVTQLEQAHCFTDARQAADKRARALAKCKASGCELDFECKDGICCEPGEVNCRGTCFDPTSPCPANQVHNPVTSCCECPPETYLCPSGGGEICMSVPCPAGKKPDPTTCICKCSNECPSDQVLNPDDCTCGCPGISCPAGESPDPKTCKCTCVASSCDGLCCNGRCIDANATCPEDDDNVCPVSGGCDSNIACYPDIPGCWCVTTTEGKAACVQSGLCEDKQLCLTSGDCFPGFACIPDNCCDDGIPRCGPICQSAANTDLADHIQPEVANGSTGFLLRAEPARSVQA
jgi:hypothetical protein